VPWKLSEINALLATGECTEARSIAALFMALEYLKARGL
jgi:ADP-ribose diphosphatase